MFRISPYLAISMTILLISCKASKVDNKYIRGSNNELSICAIDACTIKGTIITIVDEKDNYNINSPCSKVPCWALVKVNEVLSTGSRFATNITPGDEIKMFFIFTLSKTTEELFPNLDKRYPGLKNKDKFKANVACRFQPGEDDCKWVVYDYILI